ncbi:MAG: UbiA prenyltransferase family protein [candidate division WOR-3 bacterium]
MRIRDLVQLLRVKHYVKNILVFVPLIFSQKDIPGIYQNLPPTLLAFLSLSLASSFVYVINDLLDAERDKLHPTKRNRPIASGRIGKKTAIIIAISLVILSFLFGVPLGYWFLATLLAYTINGFLYSLFFKNYQLFDAFSLSFAYLLRVYAGAYAINVPVSGYLFLVIFFLSLFLAFGKRRYEIILLGERLEEFKRVLKDYSVYYLDQLMVISATLTLMVYTLYVAQSPNKLLRYTIPIVVFGIFRYYHITHNLERGEPSEDLLQDRYIMLSGLLYAFVVFLSFLMK